MHRGIEPSFLKLTYQIAADLHILASASQAFGGSRQSFYIDIQECGESALTIRFRWVIGQQRLELARTITAIESTAPLEYYSKAMLRQILEKHYAAVSVV